ncbi:MAG: DNA polymerase IV [Lachnospiraceae bacterium]|nr:DNA polymerase IV [Lachnospiraceae bacterium]
MQKKIIFHIDVNSAFLSWEAVYRLRHLGAELDLREIPSAIGGDIEKRHGIILAKSIPAKKYQIKTGESVPEALKKCPHLYLTPPNYNLYERCSNAFLDILRRFTPDVEPFSIDEAYMDMTGTEKLWGPPKEAADLVRNTIREELGFTVNVGVSENKLLAKMASDFQKPDRTHTLFPSEIAEKMWPLPVTDLFFVGHATAIKLSAMGIRTIGGLAQTDPSFLKARMKKHGEIIWAFANGLDFSVVEAQPAPNKGYGNSTTIAFDVKDHKTAKLVLLALTETVAARLRQNHVKAEVISIGIKTSEFHHTSHQRILSSPTNITKEIHQTCCQLFDELWDGSPIRHLGVHTSRIVPETSPRQIRLFDETDYEKLEDMDRAVDRIRDRFGIDSVKRAVFQKSPIDHMSGGISREKRTVNYSQLDIR